MSRTNKTANPHGNLQSVNVVYAKYVNTLSLHQGNVSKHLRLMKDAGVVACRREGSWRYYRVIDTELLALCPSKMEKT